MVTEIAVEGGTNGTTSGDRGDGSKNKKSKRIGVPSRELTDPTLGKGKSSSKMPFWGGYVI